MKNQALKTKNMRKTPPVEGNQDLQHVHMTYLFVYRRPPGVAVPTLFAFHCVLMLGSCI